MMKRGRRVWPIPEPTPLTERMAQYWCMKMLAAGYSGMHTLPVCKDGQQTGQWLIVLPRPHKEDVYIDNRELAKSYVADRQDR